MSSDVWTLFKVPIEISGWFKQKENVARALTFTCALHVICMCSLNHCYDCRGVSLFDAMTQVHTCLWAFWEARLVGRSVTFLRTAVRARKSQANFYLSRLHFRNIFLSSSWSNASLKLCFPENFRLSQWQSCCLQAADPVSRVLWGYRTCHHCLKQHFSILSASSDMFGAWYTSQNQVT